MMVMTAKVDLKKILLALAAAAALIVSVLVLLGGGGDSSAATGAVPVSNNDQRVQFLSSFGWEVTTSPTESSQVMIPEQSSEVFDRYNALQKSQGYDLSKYAGKKVMRYVYKVSNFPGSSEPVYVTLLVYKDEIIGGDLTDPAPGGRIQSFKNGPSGAQTTPSVTSRPGSY